ncbi:MAG: DUF1016 N-terminal domain-containing protein [Candidatus Adiutrix sp.]|nr:DUF1016 N-terminal domain-containing protein [Candidatus Adiutrix sp.]
MANRPPCPRLIPINSGLPFTFEKIIEIIESACERAFRAVNRELISTYWEIGHYMSENVSSNNWGQSVVLEFSRFIQLRFVGLKGFSPQNIWRMKQFYATYAGNEKLSPLVREISWVNNVLIWRKIRKMSS